MWNPFAKKAKPKPFELYDLYKDPKFEPIIRAVIVNKINNVLDDMRKEKIADLKERNQRNYKRRGNRHGK